MCEERRKKALGCWEGILLLRHRSGRRMAEEAGNAIRLRAAKTPWLLASTGGWRLLLEILICWEDHRDNKGAEVTQRRQNNQIWMLTGLGSVFWPLTLAKGQGLTFKLFSKLWDPRSCDMNRRLGKKYKGSESALNLNLE
jgi:hypothetical protein